MTVSVMWKNWRQALLIVHFDTVVRWQRERFRRHWVGLSSKPRRIGRPRIKLEIHGLIQTLAKGNAIPSTSDSACMRQLTASPNANFRCGALQP
jgi:hypothetical protein